MEQSSTTAVEFWLEVNTDRALNDVKDAITKIRADLPKAADEPLINRVDREEPADRLEAVLKTDPTLAFRLMRYINSPAFGLSVEINSFRHAIMVLGYNRLKRWLALLLASASKDPNVKPVMYAAGAAGC